MEGQGGREGLAGPDQGPAFVQGGILFRFAFVRAVSPNSGRASDEARGRVGRRGLIGLRHGNAGRWRMARRRRAAPPLERRSVCAAGVAFRRFVSADRSSGFPAEDRRYHLYAAFSCPWAHRALIMRAVKGLEECIPVSIIAPWTHAEGWSFADYPDATGDRANGYAYLHELYCHADPRYTG